MKIRCEYCGNYLSDTDEVCPSCGAPNEHLLRGAAGEPKTIGELQAFAQRHNLPLEQMRFFLGEDCREPRAFGIYQETNGDFVVYKNKSDGQRAVRYRGRDEAFAVNELYQKMRSEVQLRKAARQPRQTEQTRQGQRSPQRRRRGPNPVLLVVILVLLISVVRTLVAGGLRAGAPSWQRGLIFRHVTVRLAVHEGDQPAAVVIVQIDDDPFFHGHVSAPFLGARPQAG